MHSEETCSKERSRNHKCTGVQGDMLIIEDVIDNQQNHVSAEFGSPSCLTFSSIHPSIHVLVEMGQITSNLRYALEISLIRLNVGGTIYDPSLILHIFSQLSIPPFHLDMVQHQSTKLTDFHDARLPTAFYHRSKLHREQSQIPFP